MQKKCLIQLISLSQEGYFILYNENKIAFCFKKECFIGPQHRRFRLKKGCFSRPESAKRGIFQAWVRAWYTFWSGVGGAGMIFLASGLYSPKFHNYTEWQKGQNTVIIEHHYSISSSIIHLWSSINPIMVLHNDLTSAINHHGVP